MSIFRLLSFSLVIAAGVATLAAQSSPEKIPATVRSSDSGQMSSPTSLDLLSPNLSPNLKDGFDPPSALDRILTGDYSPHLNQFSLPHTLLHMDPDWQSQGDRVCLKMRTYKVARDEPGSDSTHAAGYSTCQPAARFHTHTIEGVIRPTKP